MHIVIDSGSYHCLNVGDVAMLQAGVERLRALWPHATLAAVTNAPSTLAKHCPGVQPIPLTGRVALLSDRFLGRADRFLPRPARDLLNDVQQRMRETWPTGLGSLISMKRALALRSDYAVAREYIDGIRRADLVVVTGAGVLTDSFLENASGVLATLAFAQQWNIPTALMGQGIGPVSNPMLRRSMAAILPRAKLIALREERESARLLESIGVPSDHVVVTGDDAIEMSYCRARAELGDGIGVNLRVAGYADVDDHAIRIVRPAVHAAATELSAALVPLPIAHHPDCHDGEAIHDILAGHPGAPATVADLPTPEAAIDAVSGCRVTVTGSYHAGVFALAQGIPVVALAASSYYMNKFAGLADLFAGGCTVVPLSAPDAERQLATAVTAAWAAAPSLRERLRKSAAAQIEQGHAAYRQLVAIMSVTAPALTC